VIIFDLSKRVGVRNMGLMDRFIVSRWGFTLAGIRCKAGFLANRLIRFPFKIFLHQVYENWNWFEKPFNMVDCVFISRDRIRAKGYECSAIMRVIFTKSEQFYFDLLDRLLHGEAVFVDVGAHLGGFTLRAARRSRLVLAIEPDPRNYYYLIMNVSLNKLTNVIVMPFAAYSTTGIAKLNISRQSELSSITDMHRKKTVSTIWVPTMPLDNIVRICNLDRVDVVKIDVEGAEFEVIIGATQILRTYRPTLLIEIHGDRQLAEIMDYLVREKYSIEILHQHPEKPWIRHIVAYPA